MTHCNIGALATAGHGTADVTPAELVTALICEKAVLLQPSREGIASLLKGT